MIINFEKSMIFVHILEEICDVFLLSDSLIVNNKVFNLCKTIHNNKNLIKKFKLWKIHNEVNEYEYS